MRTWARKKSSKSQKIAIFHFWRAIKQQKMQNKQKKTRKEFFITLKDTIYQILAESDKNCKTSSNFRRKKITYFFGFSVIFGQNLDIKCQFTVQILEIAKFWLDIWL